MEHEKTLIGNGLGRRRWGYFVRSGAVKAERLAWTLLSCT